MREDMANITEAPALLPERTDSSGGGQTIMTEFVIAITAFCALIFLSCMSIGILLVHFKRIHRDDDDDDYESGTYTNSEKSTSESNLSIHRQQGFAMARHNQQLQKQHLQQQQHRHGHKSHLLSLRDPQLAHYVREMTTAEKFWRADTVRNPMHKTPDIIF